MRAHSLFLAMLPILAACISDPITPPATPALYIVSEIDVVSEEAPPHGAFGMSTAYRISDGAEDRTMEFRKRTLHPGAAIGLHAIAHDEVYYVVSGTGIVISNGEEAELAAGDAAYLYDGATVGIRQTGEQPLTIIISYPLPGHPRLER